MDELHRVIKIALAEKVFSSDEVTVIGKNFAGGEITYGKDNKYVVGNIEFSLAEIQDIEFYGELVEIIL